jgi:hypothetical protein
MDTMDKKTADAKMAMSHFLPEPNSSLSAQSDFSTHPSFQLWAISTKSTWWNRMKRTAPLQAVFKYTSKKSESLGTKQDPNTKNMYKTYFAGQASLVAVYLHDTATPAKTNNIRTAKAALYTPACPAPFSVRESVSLSHSLNQASVK